MKAVLTIYKPLIFACWVIFNAFVVVGWLFFKINFSKIFFQEHYQSVKQFVSRSGPALWTDTPSVLIWIRLSADDIDR